QAPIVILADAAGNPDASPVRGLALKDGSRDVPIPDLAKSEIVGRVAEAEELAKREERQEHWRLLYVAMTRAEEALFIGGALGKRETEPAADSWHARLAPLMPGEALPDAIWGERYEWGEAAAPLGASEGAPPSILPPLPQWATRPVGPEPRPPRPLAPSAASEDQSADP